MVLDEHAIRLSVLVGQEETAIRLSVMKDEWENGMALLEEVLTRPEFYPEVLDVVKTEVLTNLRRQGGKARKVAMREEMIWHFKGHPYGRDPLAGLKMTRGGIARRDAVVIDECASRNIPVATTLGGGYGKEAWRAQYQSIARTIKKYGAATPRYSPRKPSVKERVYTK